MGRGPHPYLPGKGRTKMTATEADDQAVYDLSERMLEVCLANEERSGTVILEALFETIVNVMAACLCRNCRRNFARSLKGRQAFAISNQLAAEMAARSGKSVQCH
jgi:hypothetical protein